MFAVLIYCGNRMVRRQLGQLNTPGEQEGADPDEEGVGSLADKSSKRSIDLAASAGDEYLDLHSHDSNSRFHVSQRRRCSRSIGRIDEHSNTNGARQKLTQEFQPLCRQLDRENIDPGQVATRPGEAGDKAELHRVVADAKDDRDGRGRSFGHLGGIVAGWRGDDRHATTHEVSHERWKAVKLAL